MCGIVGIYEHGRSEGSVSPPLVDAMRETIHHRGPDDAGTWVSEDRRIGLAMRRLSIVDLAGGHQPMFGDAGEVLVFNGEIYNYPRLREQLEADGAVFKTTCDTEVILHLYARHGEACLDHLNGMFAFALWDSRAERLLVARDRLGEKPFYWADVDGRLVFGSEIKALLEHPAVPRAVNESVIGPYLTNLVTSAPETLYEGIYKLPPGHMGICDSSGMRIKRYWDVFAPREWNDVGLDEAAREVRSLLDRSVHDRLLADVPVGVLLSGGLDSTTLVALLKERARGIDTFSVGFDDHPEIDERDAMSFLPGLIHHQDEPLADPVCLPLHFVCQLARDNGVPVVLAGEGADELFWGYPSYKRIMEREQWMRAIMRLPSFARRMLPSLVPRGRYALVREVLEGFADGRPMPMQMPLGMTRDYRDRVLRAPGDSYGWGWSPSVANGNGDLVDRLGFDTQEYEFGLRLPELLLMRIDRFSMANSVEARVPFLDPNLVEYVYRLPRDYKMRSDGTSKIVLRQAVSDIVPDWVLARKKKGFGAPMASWLDAHMGQLFRSVMGDEAIQRYFDVGTLEGVLARGGEARNAHYGLWPILNFALWHRHWIEQEPLDDLIAPVIAAAG